MLHTARGEADAVERRRRGDVEDVARRAAEGEVADLLP
jgi:hypothetical protein